VLEGQHELGAFAWLMGGCGWFNVGRYLDGGWEDAGGLLWAVIWVVAVLSVCAEGQDPGVPDAASVLEDIVPGVCHSSSHRCVSLRRGPGRRGPALRHPRPQRRQQRDAELPSADQSCHAAGERQWEVLRVHPEGGNQRPGAQ